MFFFPINSNIGNNNRVICKEIYQFNLTVINAQRLYTLYSILHIKSKTKIKTKYKETKKKRVTAGEVDKLGKELGNSPMDDERCYKRTSAFDTKSSSD